MGALFFAVGNEPARVYTDVTPTAGGVAALRHGSRRHRRCAGRDRRRDRDAQQRRRVRPVAARCGRPGHGAPSTSPSTSGRGRAQRPVDCRAREEAARRCQRANPARRARQHQRAGRRLRGARSRRAGKCEKFRTPKFGKLTRFHRRNHRRSIVIDGDVGFTGGMAVSDVWLGHAQDKEHWRDMMFKVTGPMAEACRSAFVDLWVSASGELLLDPAQLPGAGAGGGAWRRPVRPSRQFSGRRRSVDVVFLSAAGSGRA